MAEKSGNPLTRYNPPLWELVMAYFIFGVLSAAFSFYLEASASPDFVPATGQGYLVRFDQPSWGPDEILVRYATYSQMIVWTTLRVAVDITLALGVLAMAWAAAVTALRKTS
jgi:hypothetical protein